MSDFPWLSVRPLKSRIFRLGEDLTDYIVEQVPRELIQDGVILAITSKIVSLAESRVVDKSSISKDKLIDKEADHNLGEVGYGCYLTIKSGLFIPSAGIDESNSETGQYILYPRHPFRSARRVWGNLRKRWKINNLGILFTDSHTTPLRRGVTGISLAHWGFAGLKNFIGQPDLFGRELQMTTVNVADGLAASATLMMGESSEQRPLAILQCGGTSFTKKNNRCELMMPVKDDLYYPLFSKHINRASDYSKQRIQK